MADTATFILLYGVFPLWVAAGFADWACHARTGIAATSGLKENALHWLMYGEIGIGMAAVAFLQINAAVLTIVFAVFVVHEWTVYWDLDYSTVRRDVGPFEQMVHSFLELLPLASLALLAVIADRTDWTLRLKDDPWPLSSIAIAAGASVLFNALPLAQETWSCWRSRAAATRRTRASPAPR